MNCPGWLLRFWRNLVQKWTMAFSFSFNPRNLHLLPPLPFETPTLRFPVQGRSQDFHPIIFKPFPSSTPSPFSTTTNFCFGVWKQFGGAISSGKGLPESEILQTRMDYLTPILGRSHLSINPPCRPRDNWFQDNMASNLEKFLHLVPPRPMMGGSWMLLIPHNSSSLVILINFLPLLLQLKGSGSLVSPFVFLYWFWTWTLRRFFK